MANTNTAESANARRGVTSGPWPTISPERIGTIGSTQGVKASNSPKPKNTASTVGSAPPLMSAASRSDSDTGAASPPAGRGAVAERAGVPACSEASVTVQAAGG